MKTVRCERPERCDDCGGIEEGAVMVVVGRERGRKRVAATLCLDCLRRLRETIAEAAE